MLRLVQGDITEQRPDCRQAGIAGTDIVAALVLEMIEKVTDEVGVEILERQVLWRLAEDPVGMVDEKPERVCKIWPHLTAVLNLSDRNSDFI